MSVNKTNEQLEKERIWEEYAKQGLSRWQIYRRVNLDKIKEKARENRRENYEKVLAREKESRKKRFEQNPTEYFEKQKKAGKKYYEENHEEILERRKKIYDEKNKEKVQCECGRFVVPANLREHRKTKIHSEKLLGVKKM